MRHGEEEAGIGAKIIQNVIPLPPSWIAFDASILVSLVPTILYTA